MSNFRLLLIIAVAFITSSCYFQLGGRDVRLKPDELWREARQACMRQDPRAQRYLLTRIVERFPTSNYATPARRYLGELPVCRPDASSTRPTAPYPENIKPGDSDSTETSVPDASP